MTWSWGEKISEVRAEAASESRRVGSDVCGIAGACSDGCSQWRSLAFWEFPILDAGILFFFDLFVLSFPNNLEIKGVLSAENQSLLWICQDTNKV